MSSGITFDLLTADDGSLFKASNINGVYTDAQVNSFGIENKSVISLCEFDGDIYAGTRSDGIFILSDTNASLGGNSSSEGQKSEPVLNEITVRPNPAKDEIFIDLFSTEKDTEKLVEVVNAAGDRVIVRKTRKSSLRIDLRDISAGTYLVVVSSDNSRITKKIIVL